MLRNVLLAAALLAGTTATMAVSAGPAVSIPICKANYQCTTTYYADVQHTQVNGGITRFCDGTTDSFGRLTGYAVVTQAPCGGLN
jgi:hypothetical protein